MGTASNINGIACIVMQGIAKIPTGKSLAYYSYIVPFLSVIRNTKNVAYPLFCKKSLCFTSRSRCAAYRRSACLHGVSVSAMCDRHICTKQCG